MSKCANCELDALYGYTYNGSQYTLFCAAHLPRFLYPRLSLGTLPSAESLLVLQETSTDLDVANETKKPAKKAKPTEVLEETKAGEEVTNAVGEGDDVASNSDTKNNESKVA